MNKRKKKSVDSIKTHAKLKAEWMKNPAFKAEYDALQEEYELLRKMLKARKKAGLTQADVAKSMNTQSSAIARLEASSVYAKSSPSINTLRKYAHAVGCKLEIHLKRISPKA